MKRLIVNCKTKTEEYILLTSKEITDRQVECAEAKIKETEYLINIETEKKIQAEIRAMAIERLEVKGEL